MKKLLQIMILLGTLLFLWACAGAQNIFTITYVDVDGSIIDRFEIISIEELEVPDDPLKEGYNFEGWDSIPSEVVEDIVITATYSVITFNVAYYDEDGSIIEIHEINYGEAIPSSPSLFKEGYVLEGWYIYEEDSGNTPEKWLFDNSEIKRDISLQVKWSPILNVYETLILDEEATVFIEGVVASKHSIESGFYLQDEDGTAIHIHVHSNSENLSLLKLGDKVLIEGILKTSSNSGLNLNYIQGLRIINTFSSNNEIHIERHLSLEDVISQWPEIINRRVRLESIEIDSYDQLSNVFMIDTDEDSVKVKINITSEPYLSQENLPPGTILPFIEFTVIDNISDNLSITSLDLVEFSDIAEQILDDAEYATVVTIDTLSDIESSFIYYYEEVLDLANLVNTWISRYVNEENLNKDWSTDSRISSINYRLSNIESSENIRLEIFIDEVKHFNHGIITNNEYFFAIGTSFGIYYEIIITQKEGETHEISVLLVEHIMYDPRTSYFDNSDVNYKASDLPIKKLIFTESKNYNFYSFREGRENFVEIIFEDDEVTMNNVRSNSQNTIIGNRRFQIDNGYLNYGTSYNLHWNRNELSSTSLALTDKNSRNIISISFQNWNETMHASIDFSTLDGWFAIGGNHPSFENNAFVSRRGLFEMNREWLLSPEQEFIPKVEISFSAGSSRWIDNVQVDTFSNPTLFLRLDTLDFFEAQDLIFKAINQLGLEFKLGEEYIRSITEDIMVDIPGLMNQFSYKDIDQALTINAPQLLDYFKYSSDLDSFNILVETMGLKIEPFIEISFNSKGGSTINPFYINPGGSRIGNPAVPIRSGYSFMGWYYDEEYTRPFDSSLFITDDTTLYAKWE